MTKTVLDNLCDGTALEENGAAVAEWYLTETQSRSDLLLLVPYQHDGHEFLAVIKTPYLEDAYETDPTEILKEAEQVIQRQTHKGLIYPDYDRHGGAVDTGRAKVYQSGGSYSDYWWRFIRLQDKKVEDEELAEHVADGHAPFHDVSATADLEHVPDDIEDPALLDAKVKLEIAGIELDVTLGDITESSTVQLAQKDNTYFIILKGGEPDIQVVDQNTRQPVFPDLNNFDDLATVLGDHL